MMRSKSGIKSVVFIYITLALLLAVTVLSGVFYTTYITTIYRHDGEVQSSDWPRQYAESFSSHITTENAVPKISEDGYEFLKKNNLWIQFLDNNGNQIVEYNKPVEIPNHYSFSELLKTADENRYNDYTIFLISDSYKDINYEYLMGFPIDISKKTIYFNSNRYAGGKPIVYFAIGSMCLLILIIGLLYGLWITKHLTKIVKSANEIASRKYKSKNINGSFGDVYKSLNNLNREILLGDEMRTQTDRMREEWIANITHDLKTPLSPIKGYAELLLDSDSGITTDKVQEYGKIILNNTTHAEKLINDLKLTYQLDSKTIPYHPIKTPIIRFIKELVIDIINDTCFKNRNIQFNSPQSEIWVKLDLSLFRRAIQNLVINALIHNPPNTIINISINKNTANNVCIYIADNGKGITSDEQKLLFTRYYRGTNTKERSEGSGLGLAIAEQIIELHGGKISVNSKLNEGTEFIISIPSL